MPTVTGADYPNAKIIYDGLIAMGLSTNAAAGVAGNIYQESGGNPSAPSGAGGGLFGETIANGGNASGGTMAEQLAALARYIATNGSISDINAHAQTPEAATDWFMRHYEKPNLSLANEPNRIAAAQYVASAVKSGNWPTSKGTDTPVANQNNPGGGGLLGIPKEITDFFDGIDHALKFIGSPTGWIRIIAFLAGTALILIAAYSLISVAEGHSPLENMPKIMPVPI